MTVTLASPEFTAAHLPDTPYVGLVPYGEKDAPFFFGREEEQQIVAGNLRASRLTILYGPSGVGKTSLLQAGVLHDLHERLLTTAATNSDRAPFAVCAVREWRAEPLSTVVEAIRAAVAEALGGREVAPPEAGEPLVEVLGSWTQHVRTILVVLDQFEDYFLYHPDEDLDGTFAGEFPRIVNEPNLRVNFLLSLREDAWAKLDHFEGRVPALFGNYVRVQHLDRRTGRDAIEEPVAEWNRRLPADAPQFTIESALTEAVLDAAAGGALAPDAGGVGESASADAVEAPFLQLVMERLWRACVEAGSHELSLARLQELGGAQQIVENHLHEALGALTPAEKEIAADLFRFLVTRSKTKIAHSSTDLAEWTKRPEPEVAAVLDKLCRGESGRILRTLSPTGPDEAERYELFHDVLAEPVLEWRRGFEQRRDRRRMLKRSARIVGALLVLVVVLAAAGVLALQQKHKADQKAAEADDARREATSLALASSAAALRDNHLDVALLLGLEANNRSERAEARSAMVSALQAARRSGLDTIVHARDVVRSVALSRDGNTLAAADGDAVRLWDLRGRRSLGSLNLGAAVANVTLSPDGSTLAATLDSGDVQLFGVSARVARTDPLDDPAAIKRLSPELRRPATTSYRAVKRSAGDNARSFESVTFAYGPDGRSYATVDDFDYQARFHARGARKGTPLSDDAVRVALGADGRTVAIVDSDGRIVVRNLRTREPLAKPLRTDVDAVSSLALGGQRVAAGGDGMVRVWDLRRRTPLGQTLYSGSAPSRSVAFSADGSILAYSIANDVRLLDARRHNRLGTLRGSGVTIRSVALTADGRVLATAGGRTVRLWDVQARTPRGARLPGARPGCTGVVRMPGSGFPVICELKTVSFSADGSLVAAAGNGKAIRLWDVSSHELAGTLRGHRQVVSSVAFAPRGWTLASGSYDGKVRLWDARAGRPLPRQPSTRGNEPILDVAFSPDGKTLAAGAVGGSVILWDVRTGEELGTLSGHTGAIFGVAFSPDGRTLASTATDSTIRLWDVPARRPIGQPLRADGFQIESPTFSADGNTIATATAFPQGHVQLWRDILWDTWPELRDQVCDFVLGSPTGREWRDYAADVRPRTACPG